MGRMTVIIKSDRLAFGDTPPIVVEMLDNPVTLFVARFFVTLPFLAAGLMKLLFWQPGVAEMAHVGLHPAWFFNIAALATELGGSAVILLNRYTWVGAGALGVFTVLTTFLAHRFWNFTGAEYTAQLNSFLEHATISAAFILVVVVGLRTRHQFI